MRQFIPNFAILERPIRAFVMRVLEGGAMSMARAKNRRLCDHGWSPKLQQQYDRMRLSVVDAVKRAYRDQSKIPLLIWDSSAYAWSYTICQVSPDQLKKPWREMDVQMLVTRSGIFDRTQFRWDIGSKEAYPAWRAVKFDGGWLRSPLGFVAGGDHANITFIQVPGNRPASIGTPAQARLRHWCLDWAHENFRIYSMPGEDNLFNDFHTRGGAPRRTPFLSLQEHARRLDERLTALRNPPAAGNPATWDLSHLPCKDQTSADQSPAEAGESGSPGKAGQTTPPPTEGQPQQVWRQHLVIVPPAPADTDELQRHEHNLAGVSLLPELEPDDWPSPQEISASQRQNLPQAALNSLTLRDSGEPGVRLFVDGGGKIVIPDNDLPLQVRIVAVAHQGHHGHTKARATVKLVRRVFTWKNLSSVVNQWVGRCLQCIKLQGGKLIPRPCGHQLTATRPMEVIAADFMSIRANRHSGYKHVFIVVDQLTRICICVATKDATAITAARILTDRWLAIFPEPVFLITDGGPHFTATLFREIANIRGFNHHIVAPYSQWANGGVERLNQHFANRLKALVNARSADWTEWPAYVPAIQEVMNKRLAVRDRGGKTPLELLMGIAPREALSYVA